VLNLFIPPGTLWKTIAESFTDSYHRRRPVPHHTETSRCARRERYASMYGHQIHGTRCFLYSLSFKLSITSTSNTIAIQDGHLHTVVSQIRLVGRHAWGCCQLVLRQGFHRRYCVREEPRRHSTKAVRLDTRAHSR
jgi:hypothetical protein